MDHLAEHRVTLEVALTSNVQTRAAAGYAEHPLRTLLRHGVPVTLNTDNPRASATTLAREYELAGALAGLTEEELAAVARHSVSASFL
jgi:adenosine deaminase